MIKKSLYKRLERLEALVLPDTRAPEIMTIDFIDAATGEVVKSSRIELPLRRVGSKLPGRRR
jgi:hypothetical protein